VTKYTATNQWVAYDRSGMKYVFGDTASARVGNDTSVFQATNPDGSCRFTTVWGLTQVGGNRGTVVLLLQISTREGNASPTVRALGGKENPEGRGTDYSEFEARQQRTRMSCARAAVCGGRCASSASGRGGGGRQRRGTGHLDHLDHDNQRFDETVG
jgi:hypothetical protein